MSRPSPTDFNHTQRRQTETYPGPTTYRNKVPGELDESWSEWAGGMMIKVENKGDGSPVTTFTGSVDQAALQSLLRRLYSLGLPLISVVCVDCVSEEAT